MCEAALEPLVRCLKTFTSYKEHRSEVQMRDFRQSLWGGEKSLLLGAGKKKKGKLSLSSMVHSTFSSESHLQALLLCGWCHLT